MEQLPPDLQAFKVLLQGGRARNIAENVLGDIAKKIDDFLDGLPVGDAGVDGALTGAGFSTSANNGIDQVKFAGELRELLSKAEGAYLGDDLPSYLGDAADSAMDMIKTDYRSALGNKSLASKVVAALRKLVRQYGETAQENKALAQSTTDLSGALKALAASVARLKT